MPPETNAVGLFWKAQASVGGRLQKELSFWEKKTLKNFKASLEKKIRHRS